MDSIHRVQEGLQLGLSGDLVSEDLRQCIHELSEIVAEGGITSEETLQNIFQNFCIGKWYKEKKSIKRENINL